MRGSLRTAIAASNATAGPNVIDFNIPGSGVHEIQPLLTLPDITIPVDIDGTSQPGYSGKPLIQVDGTKAGSFGNGFFGASGFTINGRQITDFSGSGIVLNASGDTIENSYIGTNGASRNPTEPGSRSAPVRSAPRSQAT